MENTAAVPAPRSRDLTVGAVCAVLMLIGLPIAYLTDNPSTGDVIGLFVVAAVSLALLAGLLLWLVPRERAAAARTSRSALILGVVALVFVLVFWTGLPFAFGAGAIALGLSVRDAVPQGPARTRGVAAVVLGGFAVLASFVVLLIG